MKYLSYLYLGALTLGLMSCDRWVDGASTPKDTLTPNQIARPRMLTSVRGKEISDGPLIANVRTLYGEAVGLSSLALGAMSDELTEGRIPNALLYRHLSADIIESNSGSADGLWNKLQDYLARSREVLEIAQSLKAGSTPEEQATLTYGLFIGHLHTAEALHLLASTFSTTPGKPGGAVLRSGQIIPHENLMRQAELHYLRAIELSSSDALRGYKGAIDPVLAQRSAHSLLLRMRLHQGRYQECADLLDRALVNNGERWQVIYNSLGADNPLYSALNSESRDVQITPDLEAARRNRAEERALPLAHKVLDKKKPDVYNIYVPSLTRHASLTVIDELEVRLIKAELILRGILSGDALAEVNAVIGKYDEASLEVEPLTLERLAHLRRVYLALRGERTHDLRRGLGGHASLSWHERKNQWIPLPEQEVRKR